MCCEQTSLYQTLELGGERYINAGRCLGLNLTAQRWDEYNSLQLSLRCAHAQMQRVSATCMHCHGHKHSPASNSARRHLGSLESTGLGATIS